MNLSILNKSFSSSLYANYLLIAYAFFLPISPKIASILMTLIIPFIFLEGNLKERFINIIQDKIIIAFTIFYFMHIVWMLGSEHLQIAYLTVKEFKYILYIIIIAMIIKKEFITKILSAFLLAMLFSESISYLMYFNLHIPLLHLNPNDGATANVPFMLSYTQYGSILGISLGIILYQTLRNKDLNFYLKTLYLVFFISASMNIFLIGSRIGYLLYFLSTATVLLFIYKNNIKYAILSILVLVSTTYLIAFNFGNIFHQRSEQGIQDIQSISENNFSTPLGIRTGYYKYSADIIKENLFFGLGTNDHIYAVKKNIIENEKDFDNKEGLFHALDSGHNASLHSEFLDIFIQFGLIGLLIFLNIFYQIFKYEQKNSTLRIIQLILLSSILFISFGSIIFITRDIGTIFILLIALTLNIKPLNSKSVHDSM